MNGFSTPAMCFPCCCQGCRARGVLKGQILRNLSRPTRQQARWVV